MGSAPSRPCSRTRRRSPATGGSSEPSPRFRPTQSPAAGRWRSFPRRGAEAPLPRNSDKKESPALRGSWRRETLENEARGEELGPFHVGDVDALLFLVHRPFDRDLLAGHRGHLRHHGVVAGKDELALVLGVVERPAGAFFLDAFDGAIRVLGLGARGAAVGLGDESGPAALRLLVLRPRERHENEAEGERGERRAREESLHNSPPPVVSRRIRLPNHIRSKRGAGWIAGGPSSKRSTGPRSLAWTPGPPWRAPSRTPW